jgi:TRAP-type C4-dicarboxylate transport system permease small subunit
MRRLSRLSNAILGLEKRLITGLAGVLVLLILLNIVTRSAGAALFWADELAIYTMIWMVLIGASVMVRLRLGIAVTLLTDLLPRKLRRAVATVADAVLFVFALAVLVLCWLWYDPIALLRAGFDLDRFALETLKFIYTEPTGTIGIPKFWIWLAVPAMALGMSVHALANLVEGPPDDNGAAAATFGAGGADAAAGARDPRPLGEA